MTSQVTVIGIDVAKETLSLCDARTGEVFELPNEARAIKAWLKTLPSHCAIAIEATGIYHVLVASLAHARKHRIYLINGFRLSNYRKGIGGRNKDDRSDAQLLARYLSHEQAQLEPWQPPSKVYCRLQALLHRRAVLVRNVTSLRQSFPGPYAGKGIEASPQAHGCPGATPGDADPARAGGGRAEGAEQALPGHRGDRATDGRSADPGVSARAFPQQRRDSRSLAVTAAGGN